MEDFIEDKIDTVRCPSCGEGIEREGRFCVNCGHPSPKKRGARFTKKYILFGAASLILAGLIGSFWIGASESKLVGKVNGEGITRNEFSKRLNRTKKFYESRYGQNLFDGEPGKENLNRLRTDLLEEMTTEKILLQEARKAGYTAVPEEEIEKELETLKKKNNLTETDLQKMIDGPIEDLKKELREGSIVSQFVEKAILKGDRVNGNLIFGQWLTEVKAKAKIETYEKLEPVSTAKASCCGTGGGCGGGGRAQTLDPKIEQEAKTKGLEYYEKKTQKKGASARATNFGCHIQVDIIEEGKVVVSLTYRGGEVEEI